MASMASLKFVLTNNNKIINKVLPWFIATRNVQMSAVRLVKEMKITKEGTTTSIEGIVKDSERKPYLVEVDNPHGACPLCRLGLKLRFSDVLIISQFMSADGRTLPQRITGLCDKSQGEIIKLVNQAKKAGLMTMLRPRGGHADPLKRHAWKGCLTYFETEEEIKWKERDEKEAHYYERPGKKKILTLKDIL